MWIICCHVFWRHRGHICILFEYLRLKIFTSAFYLPTFSQTQHFKRMWCHSFDMKNWLRLKIKKCVEQWYSLQPSFVMLQLNMIIPHFQSNDDWSSDSVLSLSEANHAHQHSLWTLIDVRGDLRSHQTRKCILELLYSI